MKKCFIVFAFAAGFAGYAQVPERLDSAVNSISINEAVSFERPDFTFYSKNYSKVFDYYQYTFDAQDYSQKSVYVGSDNKFYYGENGGIVMDMSQPAPNAYRFNCGYAYDVVGLVRGLENILSSKKDYSTSLKEDRGITVYNGNQ